MDMHEERALNDEEIKMFINRENNFMDKSLMEDRVNSYIKIAKIKYADKTADQIIDIIENGNENLKFNSEEEKELFKYKWENK